MHYSCVRITIMIIHPHQNECCIKFKANKVYPKQKDIHQLGSVNRKGTKLQSIAAFQSGLDLGGGGGGGIDVTC